MKPPSFNIEDNHDAASHSSPSLDPNTANTRLDLDRLPHQFGYILPQPSISHMDYNYEGITQHFNNNQQQPNISRNNPNFNLTIDGKTFDRHIKSSINENQTQAAYFPEQENSKQSIQYPHKFQETRLPVLDNLKPILFQKSETQPNQNTNLNQGQSVSEIRTNSSKPISGKSCNSDRGISRVINNINNDEDDENGCCEQTLDVRSNPSPTSHYHPSCSSFQRNIQICPHHNGLKFKFDDSPLNELNTNNNNQNDDPSLHVSASTRSNHSSTTFGSAAAMLTCSKGSITPLSRSQLIALQPSHLHQRQLHHNEHHCSRHNLHRQSHHGTHLPLPSPNHSHHQPQNQSDSSRCSNLSGAQTLSLSNSNSLHRSIEVSDPSQDQPQQDHVRSRLSFRSQLAFGQPFETSQPLSLDLPPGFGPSSHLIELQSPLKSLSNDGDNPFYGHGDYHRRSQSSSIPLGYHYINPDSNYHPSAVSQSPIIHHKLPQFPPIPPQQLLHNPYDFSSIRSTSLESNQLSHSRYNTNQIFSNTDNPIITNTVRISPPQVEDQPRSSQVLSASPNIESSHLPTLSKTSSHSSASHKSRSTPTPHHHLDRSKIQNVSTNNLNISKARNSSSSPPTPSQRLPKPSNNNQNTTTLSPIFDQISQQQTQHQQLQQQPPQPQFHQHPYCPQYPELQEQQHQQHSLDSANSNCPKMTVQTDPNIVNDLSNLSSLYSTLLRTNYPNQHTHLSRLFDESSKTNNIPQQSIEIQCSPLKSDQPLQHTTAFTHQDHKKISMSPNIDTPTSLDSKPASNSTPQPIQNCHNMIYSTPIALYQPLEFKSPSRNLRQLSTTPTSLFTNIVPILNPQLSARTDMPKNHNIEDNNSMKTNNITTTLTPTKISQPIDRSSNQNQSKPQPLGTVFHDPPDNNLTKNDNNTFDNNPTTDDHKKDNASVPQ
jgi:hypothetical protein